MKAPDLKISLDDGSQVLLSSLYADDKLVLIFLRHFGCTFCREQVAQLRLQSKLNVVFVGMGTVEETSEFKRKMRSPHAFIADPNREVYRAFGLGTGTGKQVFNLKVFARGFGATLRGHFVGAPIGDPWQMPGVFLIDSTGEIVWEYRSVDIADNIGSADLIRQIGATSPDAPNVGQR